MQKTIEKGTEPISKNDNAGNVPREYSSRMDYRTIRVFDGCGNELQPTYRRRAKGFVKHGRAQWCDSESGHDSIILFDRFKNSTSESDDMRTADYYYNTEDTEMSEYRENEIIKTEEKIDRETAAEIARANAEIKSNTAKSLANVQLDIISGMSETDNAVIASYYREIYEINVSALKDLVQDNKPEKVVEPTVEKAVLDIKMSFIKSSLEMIKSWCFKNEITNEEYFAKSKELLNMLDKAVAEAKAAESADGAEDDSGKVTEE